MTGRGRNYSQRDEWDDFNNSSYEQQFHDNDHSDKLDHCRLYIKNIPTALNEEGLRAAFAKFGNLVEVYLSKDPQKAYGLVRYEKAGEAKFAMMKLNKTEPLKLQISIAFKSKREGRVDAKPSRDWQDRNANSGRDAREGRDRSDRMSQSNRDREESSSVVSRSRNSRAQDDMPNGGDNNMDDLMMEDDYGFSDILDPNLHLELESLKLEQLKVREEQLQVKQRVILLKQAERRPIPQMSNRCILPDGKIIVRNNNPDRDSRDADVSFSAGAGDSSKLPGLQRNAARQCVACGEAADSYCAGCGVTPYCTEQCQRRDWQDRHLAVCHNLARRSGRTGIREVENETRAQPAQPLRRPYMVQNKRLNQDKDDQVGPSVSKASVKSGASSGKEDRQNNNQNKSSLQTRRNFIQNLNNQAQQPQNDAPKKEETVNNDPNTNNVAPSKPAGKPAAKPAEKPQVKTVSVPAPVREKKLMPKTSIPEPLIVKPEVEAKPQEVTSPPKTPTTTVAKLASVSDVTPTKKVILPHNYILEKLSIGDTVIMIVEAPAAASHITRGDYVCLAVADDFAEVYQSLCEDFSELCEKEHPCKIIPGETCAYFLEEDSSWYRARCLNATTLALLDSGKIVTLTPTSKLRKLPTMFESVPEFTAVLACGGVELFGNNLLCKILAQTPTGYKVSIVNKDTDALIGEGEAFRWLPTVEYQTFTELIPSVYRPPLSNGTKVILVLAEALDSVFVRPADSNAQRAFDDVLQQVVLAGMKAKPLTEPPQKGQVVISKFRDGLHYRALVKRTNSKLNKYMIEYIEFGNIEITTLENLLPCPPNLVVPTIKCQVSKMKLADVKDISPAAAKLIDELKANQEELILTLAEDCKTAPSGTKGSLTIVKNKVDLGKQLLQMNTPEWKKIEERGGDALETENIMFSNIEYAVLPAEGCTIQVLDINVLRGGVVSGYDVADARAKYVFGPLTAKMEEYCNSAIGKDPYLPKPEELCLAQLPPFPQWFRAVFLELCSGAGSSEAKLCYLDYGTIADVPVTSLRKMMPEFVHNHPFMGLHCEIRGFPKDPTDEMLRRAITHLKWDEEGKGFLKVTHCEKIEDGIYNVDAPDLLKAMKG